MGIKKLTKFLSLHNIQLEDVNYSNFKNKKIAIDMSILIHRILGASKELSFNKKITTHIFGVFNKMYDMLSAKIKIIAVFDGKPPPFKSINGTSEIPQEYIDDIKYLLNLMNIPMIQSYGEADTQCAYLSKQKIVDAVYSLDTDMLAFGCEYVVFSISKHKGKAIKLKNILSKLDISQTKFVEICNILGNDYYPGIYNIGPAKALDKYPLIIKSLGKNKQFNQAITYYSLDKVKIKKTPPTVFKNDGKKKIPKYKKLMHHLVVVLGFNKNNTARKLNNLADLIK